MDPVTVIDLAASIVQLITTTTQTVQYVNQIKNAPKEVGEFGQEASNVLYTAITLEGEGRRGKRSTRLLIHKRCRSWSSQRHSLSIARSLETGS